MSHVDYLGHFWPLRNLSHNMTPQLGPFHHHLQSWPCHILHGLSICVEDWSFFQILVGLNILCLSCSNILFILTWLHLLLSFLLAIRVKATLDSSVLHLSPSWIQTNNFTHALCCNASFFPFFPCIFLMFQCLISFLLLKYFLSQIQINILCRYK